MSMNPRSTTEKIKADYRSYVASILTVRDREISRLAKEEVEKTNFVKGPFLETTLPFKEESSVMSFLKWEKMFIIMIGNFEFIRKML